MGIHQERLEEIVLVGTGAGEWFHVSSKDNAADSATRAGSDLGKLGPESN